MQLVLSQRLFWLVLISFRAFPQQSCYIAVSTGDDWVNGSHGSRVYNNFGVQGEEASSIVFKWISSFLKRNNKSLNVYLSWRLFAVHGFAHGDPCSLRFWMSCYAQSFWANEQSVAQQSPTVSKHLDCWQVLLHLHFLLPSYCTAHVRGPVLVHNKSTFAKSLIHWWVDTCHKGTLITIWRSISSRAKQQQQHGNSFVSVCMNWLKYAVRMDWVNWRMLSSNSSAQLQYGNFGCARCFLDQSSNVSFLSSIFSNALCCKM